jgi:hypothetical protein
MSYVATVLRVMIASPGDITEARDAVEKAIHGWNDANAGTKQVILQPWRWEHSAVPVLGGHPQSLINSQGVDNSDIVFAMFGGRLGTPTAEGISGTAEEIDRAQAQGTPVHLYFSTGPLPADVDTAQLDALREFKAEMQRKGLLGEFSNTSQLEYEVWKTIEHDIQKMVLPPDPIGSAAAGHGVKWRVQPQQEREVSGFDSKGHPRYSTRHWLDVSNIGTVDAESVVFESVGDRSGMHIPDGSAPTVVHADTTRQVHTFHSMGGSDPQIVRITWTEDGEVQTADFHVG